MKGRNVGVGILAVPSVGRSNWSTLDITVDSAIMVHAREGMNHHDLSDIEPLQRKDEQLKIIKNC